MPPPGRRRGQQTEVRVPEPMDDTFVGMTGGQIFHEMMLRHEVKQVRCSIIDRG